MRLQTPRKLLPKSSCPMLLNSNAPASLCATLLLIQELHNALIPSSSACSTASNGCWRFVLQACAPLPTYFPVAAIAGSLEFTIAQMAKIDAAYTAAFPDRG